MSKLREAFKETNKAAIGVAKPIGIAFAIVIAVVFYLLGIVQFILSFEFSVGQGMLIFYSVVLVHVMVIAYGVTLYRKFKGQDNET